MADLDPGDTTCFPSYIQASCLTVLLSTSSVSTQSHISEPRSSSFRAKHSVITHTDEKHRHQVEKLAELNFFVEKARRNFERRN